MTEKVDRRVQRTRELLRQALMTLIDEKGYDAITIQDITEKANLGRTTFYLHYQSKDDLMLDHHADVGMNFNFGILSREQLLGDAPNADFVKFLEELAKDRALYFSITKAKDGQEIMRGIRQQMVKSLEESLEIAFPECEPSYSRDALVNYIVSAQVAFIDWWMNERHQRYRPEEIALMLHRTERILIKEAFELNG